MMIITCALHRLRLRKERSNQTEIVALRRHDPNTNSCSRADVILI